MVDVGCGCFCRTVCIGMGIPCVTAFSDPDIDNRGFCLCGHQCEDVLQNYESRPRGQEVIAIYKYPLPAVPEWITHTENGAARFGIQMPVVELLDIQMQDASPTVWAIVDTEQEPRQWEFFALPIGFEMQDDGINLDYFKTLQVGYGLVFHFFYVPQMVYPSNPAKKRFLGSDR